MPMPVTHSRRRRAVVVHVECRQRRELEKGGARVDETLDALARGHLVATPVLLDGIAAAAGSDRDEPLAQLADEPLHPLGVRAKLSERRSNRDSNSAIAAPFGTPRLEPG